MILPSITMICVPPWYPEEEVCVSQVMWRKAVLAVAVSQITFHGWGWSIRWKKLAMKLKGQSS